MKRRRLLTIAGASLALAGIPAASRARTWQWRGTVLGAEGMIKLVHHDGDEARRVITTVVDELRRLERIFSLYDPNSAISRLNRDGQLKFPPPELVALLSTAQWMGEITGSAFDVSVQPLWRLYASHFSRRGADPDGPHRAAIDAALARVGYEHVDVSTGEIAFSRPNMAITMNGIAQGYIADRIIERLRDLGLTDTLVNTGEIRVLGRRPDGRPWRIALEEPAAIEELTDQAIATSAASGTRFDSTGRFHHLLDPHTGLPGATGQRRISVIANRATVADAASTAFSIVQPDIATKLAAQLQVRCVRPDTETI